MLDPKKLQDELKKKGWKLIDLAEVSGLNYANLSNINTGKVQAREETTLRIAEAIGIHPYRLLRNELLPPEHVLALREKKEVSVTITADGKEMKISMKI